MMEGTKLPYQDSTQTNFQLDHTKHFSAVAEIPLSPAVILQVVVLFLILAVGFIGNALVVGVVFLNRQMRTRTNLLLTQLAITGVGVCLFCIPFMIVALIKQSWILGDSLCQLNGFMFPFWLCSSIFTLSAIGIHKYFSVAMPLRKIITQRRVFIVMIAAWIAASACSVGPVLGWTEIVYQSSSATCGSRFPQNGMEISHTIFLLFAVYIAPIVGTAFLYWRIIRAVKSHCRRIRDTAIIDDRGILAQRKIVITLIFVFATFVACWTPFFVYGILTLATDPTRLSRHFVHSVYTCGFLFSACNPVIVATRNPRFRRGFKELLTFYILRSHSNADLNQRGYAKLRRPSEDYRTEKRCSVWFMSSRSSLLSLEPEPVNRRRKLRWIETNL